MKKGPTSYTVKGMIMECEKNYRKSKKPIFKRLAEELKKPRRQKREINISKLNRYTKEGDNVIVIGKLLSSGVLDHKLNIIAFDCSSEALKKVKESKSNIILLKEWLKEPKIPERVMLIG